MCFVELVRGLGRVGRLERLRGGVLVIIRGFVMMMVVVVVRSRKGRGKRLGWRLL